MRRLLATIPLAFVFAISVAPEMSTRAMAMVGVGSVSFSTPGATARRAGPAVPIAHAGVGQTVEGASTVTLNGSSSWDADGDALEFTWTQTEGPAVSLDLTDPSHPTFTAPTPGAGATGRLKPERGGTPFVGVDVMRVQRR